MDPAIFFSQLFKAPRTYPKGWLQSLVQLMGGKILHTDPIEVGWHGRLVVEPDFTFTIRLSCYSSPVADNYTIAHALGHYAMDVHRNLDKPHVFHCERQCTSDEVKRFALLLLIPEYDSSMNDQKLSWKFDVKEDIIRARRNIQE